MPWLLVGLVAGALATLAWYSWMGPARFGDGAAEPASGGAADQRGGVLRSTGGSGASGRIEDRLPRAPHVSGPTGATGVGVGGPTGVGVGGPTGVGVGGPTGVGVGGPTGSGSAVIVHVVGAVVRPGVVRLPTGARIEQAVAAAGGFNARADAAGLNLAAPVADGARIRVPAVGEPPVIEVPSAMSTPGPGAPATTGAHGGGVRGGSGGSGVSGAAGPVDVNTADAEALDRLPGVGPATAAAIIRFREANGRFASIEDLLEVPGIGQARLDALRDQVTVG